MIPKVIHYIWLGDNKCPEACKSTWKTEGYEVIEWNEQSECVAQDERIQLLIKNKKWAYASDYLRIKLLYEYGGIYMDTDVWMLRSLDSLLEKEMVLGYIYPKSIGTAVIGCRPHHPFIKQVIAYYDKFVLPAYVAGQYEVVLDNGIKLINNNDIFTWLLLQNYPDFVLNGKEQELSDITLLRAIAFEQGGLGKSCYTIHRCNGSWIADRHIEDKKVSYIDLLADMLRLRYSAVRLKNKLPFREY